MNALLKISLLSLILFNNYSFSFAQNNKLTTTRLEKIENEMRSLRLSNDSLRRELVTYRAKEDLVLAMFQTMESKIDSSIGIMLTIMSLMLALVGIVIPFATYNFWKWFTKKMDNVIYKSKEQFELFKSKFDEMENSQSRKIANLFHLSSHLAATVSNDRVGRVHALKVSLIAIRVTYNHFMQFSVKNVYDQEAVNNELNKSLYILSRIPSEDWVKKDHEAIKLLWEKELFISKESILLKLHELPYPEIKKNSFDLYLKLKKLVESEIVN